MPCRDYEPDEVYQNNLTAMSEKLDNVTALLCGLCGSLEDGNILNDYADLSVRTWWKEHKKADKARRKAEREAARVSVVSVLDKLTDDELKVLGLNREDYTKKAKGDKKRGKGKAKAGGGQDGSV